MRKLLFLLFPTFAVLLALNCSGDSNMPCASCAEMFPSVQQKPSSSSFSSPSSSSSVASSSSEKEESSSSSIASSSSEEEESSSSIVLDPCVDDYDVRIGNQTWQRCNSNVEPSSGKSRCYDDEESNCEIYGTLYDWEAAKSACPDDFHLPTKNEWLELMSQVESDSDCDNCAGKLLKSKDGWNGEDIYDFSALPGGAYSGDFSDINKNGYWWSADEENGKGVGISMSLSDRNSESLYPKDLLFSVRCLKD